MNPRQDGIGLLTGGKSEVFEPLKVVLNRLNAFLKTLFATTVKVNLITSQGEYWPGRTLPKRNAETC